MLKADKYFEQFCYKDAHQTYIESIEGYMDLYKITKDDANFQEFLKHRLNYTMDRVSFFHNNVYYLGLKMQDVPDDVAPV